ncbi:MAG: arsenate reductase ArsC [Thermoflavifilum sp.]|nr:arsenate reductase ArsC [Thermoflavifilum sp.]
MKRVLVLCTGNSCRSQMAQGYLQYFAPTAEIYSAGLEARGVHPYAIRVMAEDGVDISHHQSHLVDMYLGKEFDYVITVCDHAREHCPHFPGRAIHIHRSFPDPAQASGTEQDILQVFRKVRDEIKVFCREFATKNLSNM